MKIFEKIEYTELTTIELTSKKDAALMFELQNNRGKDLTNMDTKTIRNSMKKYKVEYYDIKKKLLE